MSPRVLIIADDLTGALDSGVAFTRELERVLVARTIEALPEVLAEGANVICINTQSREGSEADAVAKIKRIAEILRFPEFEIVIKKVDSRLKGHVKAETQTLIDVMGAQNLFVAPAIPEMGRIQKRALLHGTGIERSIPISQFFPESAIIPDIIKQTDLVDAISDEPLTDLWIGARGLTFGLARKFSNNEVPSDIQIHRPALLAIGSRDPITVAQVSTLQREMPVMYAPNGTVPYVEFLSDFTCVAIESGQTNITSHEAAKEFASGIAKICRRNQPKCLFACGGETANTIMEMLDVNILEIKGEYRVGVPICLVRTNWGDVQILTKSGGFGQPDFLTKLAKTRATL